jgi:glutamine synthetase adenylyltransferase
MGEIQALVYEIENLKLQHAFVCQNYELTITQNKVKHDLDMAHLTSNLLFDKDKETQALKTKLSSTMEELDQLKTELSSVKSITSQKDASEKEKKEFRELVEKLVTWPYKKLIINAEDLIEDIFFLIHTNALESSYLDLQTQVEVLQNMVNKQKQTIKRLKKSLGTNDVFVDTKTQQITEHTTPTSTATVCHVKPSPFAVVLK